MRTCEKCDQILDEVSVRCMCEEGDLAEQVANLRKAGSICYAAWEGTAARYERNRRAIGERLATLETLCVDIQGRMEQGEREQDAARIAGEEEIGTRLKTLEKRLLDHTKTLADTLVAHAGHIDAIKTQLREEMNPLARRTELIDIIKRLTALEAAEPDEPSEVEAPGPYTRCRNCGTIKDRVLQKREGVAQMCRNVAECEECKPQAAVGAEPEPPTCAHGVIGFCTKCLLEPKETAVGASAMSEFRSCGICQFEDVGDPCCPHAECDECHGFSKWQGASEAPAFPPIAPGSEVLYTDEQGNTRVRWPGWHHRLLSDVNSGPTRRHIAAVAIGEWRTAWLARACVWAMLGKAREQWRAWREGGE